MLAEILMAQQLSARQPADAKAACEAIVDALIASAGMEGVKRQCVPAGHWALQRPGQDRVAAAMRTDTGGEWVVVDQGRVQAPIVQHELGHLKAWREHGENIPQHGREFKQACRQTVTTNKTKFCSEQF